MVEIDVGGGLDMLEGARRVTMAVACKLRLRYA